jgi:glycosyltransferase involved in cell wall biosynthesis
MRVSVVIAARDAEQYIAATLDSLVAQAAHDFEVIVVDDGSRDATMAIVGGFSGKLPALARVKGATRGVSAARNTGLARAGAPYVLFLDADDLLAGHALDALAARLDETAAVAVLGGIAMISEAGAPFPSNDNRALVPAGDTLPALLRKNFVVNGGALMIRTEIAREIGGYDESLKFGEDWEFWCRLAERGNFALVSGAPHLFYRQRAAGANYQKRGGALALRVPCLDAIAANERMRRRFGASLRRILRARRIDIFWSGVRNEFRFGAKWRALAVGVAGLILYPDSAARPRLIVRFLKNLRGADV